MNEPNRIFYTLAGIGALALALVAAFQLVNRQLSPTDSSALYGGELETGYLTMGYVINFKTAGGIEFCSVSFFSELTGVSAAHCFDKPGEFYVGRGEFTLNASQLIPVSSYRQSAGWDHSNSANDIATFTLTRPIYTVGDFTSISSVADGCNYRVVAYGRTEADVNGVDPQRPKRSANVCLTNQGNGLVRINSFTSGLCMGDSGSPIFIDGTDSIVAVVSAISRPAGTNELCYIGNTGVGVNLASQTSFLQAGLGQPVVASDVVAPAPTVTVAGSIFTNIPIPLVGFGVGFLVLVAVMTWVLRKLGRK